MSKGGMHPADVKAEISKLDESTNRSGRSNTDSSPVAGARKSAGAAHNSRSSTGGMSESAFAESNRAQRRR